MKKCYRYMTAVSVLLMTALLAGCVRVVQEAPKVDSSEASTSAAAVASSTGETTQEVVEEPAEEPVEEEPAEEGPFADFPEAVAEGGYDDIQEIIDGDLYAVLDQGAWYVVDKDNDRAFDEGYDYFATDGGTFFSLSTEADGEYISRLYYYDTRTKESEEIFINDEFPEMDIVEITPPFLRMATRTRNGEAGIVPVVYLEWEDAGDRFDFYMLTYLTQNNVAQAGFDASRWTAMSGFSDDISATGGIFIDCPEYYFDPATDVYYNIIGCTANNELLFSEDEEEYAIEMLPYVPTADGYYAGYVIDVATKEKQLSYGNISSGVFSSEQMTAFPEDAVSAAPYTGDEAEGSWIVLTDEEGNERIFDMAADAYVEE